MVMTSGLGGVYPRGIPIGRVAGVRREELGWERVYRLMPLGNPGHVSHVLVLKARGFTAVPDSVP
jgi:rod shape-determining protein MreC